MKKCPNCGEMMAANVNFCTNCGTDLRQVSAEKEQTENQVAPEVKTEPKPTQSVSAASQPVQTTRAQVQQTQQVPGPNGFSQYWAWNVAAWKQPTAEVKNEKWYGLVNIAIEIVLFMISCWKMLQNGINTMTSSLNNSAAGSFFSNSANQVANQQSGNILGKLFVFLIIAVAIMIALSIAGYAFTYKRHVDVIAYINRVVQYSNYLVIINIIILLLALMGTGMSAVMFFVFVSILIFTLANVAPVMMDDNNVKDKVLGGLITIAGLLIAGIVFHYMLSSLIQSIGSSLTSFLK